MGLLWENLTADQKDIIKDDVFSQVLKDSGFDASQYPNEDFVFTAAQLKAEKDK